MAMRFVPQSKISIIMNQLNELNNKLLATYNEMSIKVSMLENQVASLRMENAKLTHDIQDMKDIFNLKIDSLDDSLNSAIFELQRMKKN